MSMELNFEIWAVDPKDRNHKALIGACFNKGLAKAWAEETITIDDILIVSKSSKEHWIFIKKEKRWEDLDFKSN